MRVRVRTQSFIFSIRKKIMQLKGLNVLANIAHKCMYMHAFVCIYAHVSTYVCSYVDVCVCINSKIA